MDLREVREFIKDSFGYIIVIFVVMIVFIFIVSFQQVNGNSMIPNYSNGDILILSKISYKLLDIKRGDVVALTGKNGALYIKRVIAVPGDSIYSLNGKVYVNDVVLEEEYLDKVTTKDFSLEYICEECNNVILNNQFFVMGDNRNDSYDSRFKGFGLVEKENIIGKVIFRIFPINKIGIVK